MEDTCENKRHTHTHKARGKSCNLKTKANTTARCSCVLPSSFAFCLLFGFARFLLLPFQLILLCVCFFINLFACLNLYYNSDFQELPGFGELNATVNMRDPLVNSKAI